jgi:DNA-binding transcriptional ArsR family regulator
MNFSQLQERVRLELLRRIERRTLSVSMLARQTEMGQPHISNFLRKQRGLSVGALDKIMAAQHMEVADLLPARREGGWGELLTGQHGEMVEVPLVSFEVAAAEAFIGTSKVQSMQPLPASELKHLVARCSPARRQWDRFVAVRMGPEDAAPMTPVVRAQALLVLDRHYNSLVAYHADRMNLYAVRRGARLAIRYADLQSDRVVLWGQDPGFPAEVLEAEPGEGVREMLIGRVALMLGSP